jgi:hypothetical protein
MFVREKESICPIGIPALLLGSPSSLAIKGVGAYLIGITK